MPKDYLDDIGLSFEYQVLVNQVEAISSRILYHLPRTLQEYPDHGVAHSKNLINLFRQFLENLKNFYDQDFSQEEKLLICLAIWLHDIGNLLGREKHSKNSVKLLEEIKEFKSLKFEIGDSLFKCLKFVILSHSSWYNLSEVPTEPIHPQVNLLKVCAVFRLLDECDISSERTTIIFNILKKYNLLDKDSKGYWEAHNEIISVVFQNNKIIINCENRNKAEILIGHLRKNLNEINNIFHKMGLPIFTLETKENEKLW